MPLGKILLCETMVREENYTPFNDQKLCFVQHAEWPGVGRPIGGLEFVCSKGLGAKLVSQSKFHIAIHSAKYGNSM